MTLTDKRPIALHHVIWDEETGPIQKAGLPGWPGWKQDLQLIKVYVDKIKAAFSQAATQAQDLIAQWWAGTYATTRSGLIDAIQQLLQTQLGQVLRGLWTEGWHIGNQSAKSLIAGLPDVDWGDWVPGDPEAAALDDSAGSLMRLLNGYGINMIKSVSATNMDQLAAAINTALENGDSSASLAKQLPGILNAPARAEMIARTEVARAVSAATVNRYQQDNITRKEWAIAPDERVCPVCRANAEVGGIPTAQAFPDGLIAPPGHPNCRCALIPAEVYGISLTDPDTVVSDAIAAAAVPDLVKVGPEGYIHGYICVRPPCGKEPGKISPDDLWFRKKDGAIIHAPSGYRVGSFTKDAGTYTITHHDGSQIYSGPRKGEAQAAMAAHHNALSGTATPKTPLKMTTSGGYTVEVVSTEDKGQYFSVTDPHGFKVPLEPWNPQSHAEIRTTDQLQQVLTREGQDYATLSEPSPKILVPDPVPEAVKPLVKPDVKPVVPEVPKPVPVKTPDPIKAVLPEVTTGPPLDADRIGTQFRDLSDRLKKELTDSMDISYGAGSRMPYSSFRVMADKIAKGDGSDLEPHTDQFGGHIPAVAAEKLAYLRRAVKDSLDDKGESWETKQWTAAGRARIAQYAVEAKELEDEIRAHDTTPPLVPGSYIPVPEQHLTGNFDDLLSSSDAVAIKSLIGQKSLSFKDENDAEKLDNLKSRSIAKALRNAGLLPDAAYFISGGDTEINEDWYGFTGVKRAVGSWSVNGGEHAEAASQMYKDSMDLPEPPPLKSTDFSGAFVRDGAEFIFSDMSSDAKFRRTGAIHYWVPRAQQAYTQNVMKEVTTKPEIPVSRIVAGSYASSILGADKTGQPWKANSRTLSSWAQPSTMASAKKFVSAMQDQSSVAKVTQMVPSSSIYMHYRGEGVLRNYVKVLGEIVPVNANLSSETTQVEDVTPPPKKPYSW
jgi:SPP1 gp7 family putative phage head morphogenesis protein